MTFGSVSRRSLNVHETGCIFRRTPLGYQTEYSLTYEIPNENEDLSTKAVIRDTLSADEDSDICFALYRDGKMKQACKWYDHEKDMLAMSLQFPAVTFTLEGQGEEPEDRWRKQFKNGKMREVRAVLTFPEWPDW
jgi:hypothetical protein